ncbi:MAG: hypothetical protein JWM59_1019 [Verrucomicrobiales bacterium]|nr:hypothetical protein [Verrucomicrobiales bacterium]
MGPVAQRSEHIIVSPNSCRRPFPYPSFGKPVKARNIDHFLKLQQLACGLVHWISRRAETDPSLLSETMVGNWRNVSSAESWLRESAGIFPVKLRPSRADFKTLANLFLGFFRTSFHVGEAPGRHPDDYEDVPRPRLLPGAPEGTKSTQAKKRLRDSMREFRLAALSHLASDSRRAVDAYDLAQLERRADLEDPLMLWAWFQELMRRVSFDFQRPAFHELWNDLGAERRRSMNLTRILAARDTLLKALAEVS